MTDIWVTLTIIGGVILVVDFVTTQLRRRAKRMPVSLNQKQKERGSNALEE
jgi:hypothetical protein